ncbi:MAG TPA: hypothetical protein GX739_04400 [Firmicutes bacterium]|nr:hypothetical protein [Bacillota bacterium]
MKYRLRKKTNLNHGNSQKNKGDDFVSMLDTKTGGPMGVLDGEDLKGRSKQKSD